MRMLSVVSLAVGTVALMLSYLAPASAQEVPPGDIPPGLTEAIGDYVQAQHGQPYVGDCSETNLPEDAGNWCSAVTSLSDTHATVSVGPAFSEFVESGLVFEQVNGQWFAPGGPPDEQPAGPTPTQPAEPSPTPDPALPDTGSGAGGPGAAPAAAMAVASLLAMATGVSLAALGFARRTVR